MLFVDQPLCLRGCCVPQPHATTSDSHPSPQMDTNREECPPLNVPVFLCLLARRHLQQWRCQSFGDILQIFGETLRHSTSELHMLRVFRMDMRRKTHILRRQQHIVLADLSRVRHQYVLACGDTDDTSASGGRICGSPL